MRAVAPGLEPPPLAFTWHDANAAAEAWGANCGPAALAAAARVPIETVRGTIPGFETKHYTSPTMMRAGLEALGVRLLEDLRGQERDPAHFPTDGLVRLQWEGPWTAPGMNPRWAYGHTHWIASRLWRTVGDPRIWIFDVNGGWLPADWWVADVVPLITREIRRATGGWHATHRWALEVRT